jgi:menaquinone-dependent protoporphyrinogen oxidase
LGGRTLVAYSSWAGSTAGIAEIVAETLRTRDVEVDLMPIHAVEDLEPYCAVVVGSGVRAGRLHKDALRFVKKHAAALQARAVACFIVCLTMMEDNAKNRATADAYLDVLRESVTPLDVGLFGGVFRPGDLNGMAKLVVSLSRLPRGDFRDLDAARAWAEQLRPKLAPRA